MRKIDTIFKKTIVYEGLQYCGKQKSVALLERIWKFDDVVASKSTNAAI